MLKPTLRMQVLPRVTVSVLVRVRVALLRIRAAVLAELVPPQAIVATGTAPAAVPVPPTGEVGRTVQLPVQLLPSLPSLPSGNRQDQMHSRRQSEREAEIVDLYLPMRTSVAMGVIN
jgi:hypothetical protein